jgi:aminoglycoside phosphotransferase (APT) family kinase protein
MLSDQDLARLGAKLEAVLPGDGAVILKDVARIHGGASRQTYRFDAVRGAETTGLILRRDPADSLIDTERRLEYAAYLSFAGSDVPAPRPLLLEEGSETLGSPFFVMSRVDGGVTGTPFQPNSYAPHAEALSRDFFTILGRIAKADPAATPLTDVVETPAPEACWSKELTYWEGVLDKDQMQPMPIARAAIRALRRAPPPSAQKLSVVHGDYRSGNFLHDQQGTILAILDWEMAHIGDPLEDLAWALDPMWAGPDPNRTLEGVVRAEAIRVWEAASGLSCDPAAFAWWELFASVKGLAIWASAGRSYADGKNTDPVLAWSSWFCTQMHERIIARRLLERLPA